MRRAWSPLANPQLSVPTVSTDGLSCERIISICMITSAHSYTPPTVTLPVYPRLTMATQPHPDDAYLDDEDPAKRHLLSDPIKIETTRLRFLALQDLTALRAFEFPGTTAPVGLSIAIPPGATDTFNWHRIHRATIENLLLLIVTYYRRVHSTLDIRVVQRILMAVTPLPPLPEADITPDEAHLATAWSHQAASLDIRALEQQSVDMLVEQIYLQDRLHQDEASFIQYVPHLCEHYRTPLFHTGKKEFYTLVTVTFENHPGRATLSWDSSEAIFHPTLPSTLLKYP